MTEPTPLTVEQAMALTPRTTLYELGEYNADGTARRWTVSGAAKTWKRSPGKFRVPIKCGIFDYGYITPENMELLTLTEPEPIKRSRTEHD